MTDERRFDELLAEFERVGVDPDSFPAGIDVHPEAAMRILRSLADDAGPAAFLAAVREEQLVPRTPPHGSDRRMLG
jgi:hypothetical protein